MTNPNSEVRHIRTVRERLSLASSETDADLNTRLSALSVDQQLELSRLYDELDQAVEVVRGKLGPEPDPSYEPSRHRMIAGKEQFIRDRALTFAKQEPFGQDAISAELRNRDASADDFVEVESLERLQIRGFKLSLIHI